MKIRSLNQRIIISAIIVLFLFITLTATALNRAYKSSAKATLKETLSSQLFALIASAEVENNKGLKQFYMPSNDLDNLLGLPNSGLYAQVINKEGDVLWQSESHIGSSLPAPTFINAGEKIFNKIKYLDSKLYRLSYGINWIVNEQDFPITFVISNDLSSYNQQISKYRDTLWFWLGGMAIFLIISQVFILRWGLQPIHQVVEELKKIESGEQQQIEHSYPKEIEYLSDNINHLLAKELSQKKRYRDALGDLAHSLKTPLAILQSSVSDTDDTEVNEQITRMNSIVEYQLQRASTSGSNNLTQKIDIVQLIQRIIDSLQKVYQDKQVTCDIQYSETTHFKADEGDMMELFGNLIDNAYKWANHCINIDLVVQNQVLQVTIIDDGKGFPDDLIDDLKQRGKRADQNVAGHGIGLSIVNNIVQSYQGRLTIKNTQTSGASIRVILQ